MGSIYPRETEDWHLIAPREHEKKVESKINGHPPLWRPLLLKNLQTWNSELNLPFVKYRALLKSISLDSWVSTGLPITKDLSCEKCYSCPSDDDDWYHPQIKEYLDEAFNDESIDLVYWDCVLFFMNKNPISKNEGFVKKNWHKFRYYGSNGYALRNNIDNSPRMDHVVAKKIFNQSSNVKYIDKCLSIWLRHPASTCFLYTFDLDIDEIYKPIFPKLNNDTIWAKEYVNKSIEFTLELKPRIIF